MSLFWCLHGAKLTGFQYIAKIIEVTSLFLVKLGNKEWQQMASLGPFLGQIITIWSLVTIGNHHCTSIADVTFQHIDYDMIELKTAYYLN